MLRLPSLPTDRSVVNLPLMDYTAAELIEVLLLADRMYRDDRCDSILRQDPALALWGACRADSLGEKPPASIRELAVWFSRNLLSILIWSHEELFAAPPVSDCLATRYQELAETGVRVARMAEQLSPSGDIADRAYLFGLLHNAHQWLAAADLSGRAITTDYSTTCMPSWLAESLAEIEAGDATSPPVQSVVAAQARPTVGSESDAASLPSQETQASSLGNRSVHCLPLLVEKLSRLQRLETEFEDTLLQQKLLSLKELAYGASHEINNPLANISTRAQTLLLDETDPQRRRKLATIHNQAMRAHEMISNMMLFAKPSQLKTQPTDLVAVIEEVIAELLPRAEIQGTSITRLGDEPRQAIVADGVQLAVAINALLDNSLQAIGSGGCVEVEIIDDDSAREIQIIVRDNGPGIEEQQRPHLFDPFYSGREAGRGLGFGLSKCWRVVTHHGGRIEVADDLQTGAQFTITLLRGAQETKPVDAAA